MTTKDAASLSSSLLKRGTRDQSHGFVLGRGAPEGENAVGVERPDQGLDQPPEPLETALRAQRDEGGGSRAAEVDQAMPDPKGGADDPLSKLVSGVVQRYNQAFPFDPFIASPASRSSPAAKPAEKPADQSRPGSTADVPESRDPGALAGPITGPASPIERRDRPCDPVGGSLDVLAQRIETMVQASVEPAEPADNRRETEPAVRPDRRGHEDLGPCSEDPEPSVGPPSAAADPAPSRQTQEIVEALRRGERGRAEQLFGRLTGLTPAEVDRMLYHSNGDTLAAACRSVNMEQLQFVSLFLMIRSATGATESVDDSDFRGTMAAFGDMSQAQAEALLAEWRQGSVS